MVDEGATAKVGRIDPETAWRKLRDNADACLVDVRTRAEWAFVGTPDVSEISRPLWLIEWRSFPDMSPNPAFGDAFQAQYAAAQPREVFFICRSGARSMEAASVVAASFGSAENAPALFNVEEGFEGDLDADRRRGRANGWKARGLPWRQS